MVQVTAPRYPCSKQERKVQIPGFVEAVKQTMRTGWYLRVLTPGHVQAGDALTLTERPYPEATIHRLNANLFGKLEPDFARAVLALPEVHPGWKEILAHKIG